jgi:adenosylcobinamide amidohydrolase
VAGSPALCSNTAVHIELSEDERYLAVHFTEPQRTLSWAPIGGGFGLYRGVVWHHVQCAELPVEVDASALLRERLAQAGYRDVVGLLTARRLAPYAHAEARAGGQRAFALATAGLGNALRVGDPPHAERVGTINVMCWVSGALDQSALVEAIALASEARTTAILELGHPSIVSGAPATGTGTDCIVVACPDAVALAPYAGKHTPIGAALGAAVLEATRSAAATWLSEQSAAPLRPARKTLQR